MCRISHGNSRWILPRDTLLSVRASIACVGVLTLVAGLQNAGADSDPRQAGLSELCRVDGRLLPAAWSALDDGENPDRARALTARTGLAVSSVAVAVFAHGAPMQELSHWIASARDPRFTPRCALALARDGRASVALAPRSIERLAGEGGVVFALPANLGALRLVDRDDADNVTEQVVTATEPVRCDSQSDCQLTAHYGADVVVLARWGRVGEAPMEREVPSRREALVTINSARGRAGLGPLRVDPLLGRLAQDRAVELARARRVTHALETTDTPVERALRFGLGAEALGENVARAHSFSDAHARLMTSPTHRQTLLYPAFDAVGIGVAQAGRDVYVVELFAARPSLQGR